MTFGGSIKHSHSKVFKRLLVSFLSDRQTDISGWKDHVWLRVSEMSQFLQAKVVDDTRNSTQQLDVSQD